MANSCLVYIAPNNNRSNRLSNKTIMILIILLAAALLVAVGVQAGVAMSHANLKHGSEATLARQCMNGEQHFYLFVNPTTNRYGTVCQIEGTWGVVITDQAGHEITSFVKNKMTRFDQVITYMRNAGYELIH
jgi:hypothetical protein